MSTTTQISAAHGVRPRQPAPEPTVPLLRGGTYRLDEQTPGLFTMVVFNRGLHCPVCRAQLSELNRRFDELAEKGIDVVSISGESEQRANQMRDEWKIDKVPLAYGLSEAQMREWGLFVSRGINADEPAVFNEPALFLISPDGSVYYESILSMPVGRPRLDDLLGGIDYWTANDYPARGEA
jgi:peroxiredoxin